MPLSQPHTKQTYSASTGATVDTVELATSVLTADDDVDIDANGVKLPDVVIHGLHLEGAEWDATAQCLRTPTTTQLYTPLPRVLLQPCVRVLATRTPQGPGAGDRTAGTYRCPLYRTVARAGTLSTSGHSTNFVMWLCVPSGFQQHWRRALPSEPGFADGAWVTDSEEWVRAGVAAFLSLPA